MANVPGDMARLAAAAPLKAKGDKPKTEAEQTNVDPFPLVPFESLGFKLDSKGAVYANDGGGTTQTLGSVVLTIKGFSFPFSCKIYKITEKDGTKRVKLSMPSSGKGFPRPVFVPEDPEVVRAYAAWRDATEGQFVAWFRSLAAGTKASAQTVSKAGNGTVLTEDL